MTSNASVLIVGGGARGHALGEAMLASPSVRRVVFAPGTSGLEARGFETAPVATQDLRGLVEHAMLEGYDLTIVGPNTPLVDGIVDRFEAEGLAVFGPTQAAARLEGSKAYARLLMSHLGIPTPRFALCDNAERATYLARTQRWGRVFKTDGIAYGKGVRVTQRYAEVAEALEDILVDNVYGLESERIVVEERLVGEEITVFALTDGFDLAVLGHVHNHPRLLDGERGPPTRGMGQVCPAPQVSPEMLQRIEDVVLRPTLREMEDRGTPLRGAFFVDFMLVNGEPYALDYNVRFGDPATQTILSSYTGDVYRALAACRVRGELLPAVASLTRDERPRVSVVVACEGYPDRFVRGDPIDVQTSVFEEDPDLLLFEDGVKVTPTGPETTGGRAFTVVAAGVTVADARSRAYRGIRAIQFRGRHVRSDIAASALA
jgi:phosphoribosylamine--glycine ligase